MNRRLETLVIGWFSFELMGATAGDLIAKDIVCEWLREAGIRPRVAMWQPNRPDEIQTEAVKPADVDIVVFVCGPIGDGPPLNTYLDCFPHARKFAINVTLLQSRAEWNPFAGIIERDSTERVNPDLTFGAQNQTVPVIGLIYVGPQNEYPTDRHAFVEAVVAETLADRDVAVVPIDTRLDDNKYGLRSPEQIESLIAKMDLVITTRLHGAVLALRRGVPPVAIDSIPGGSKLLQQMQYVGWCLALDVAALSREKLERTLDEALCPQSRQQAAACAMHAAEKVARLKDEFLRWVCSI